MRFKMVKLNRGMSWSTSHVIQVFEKVQGHDLKVIIGLVEFFIMNFMKFLRLLESWKFRKFSWPPVTLPVRIKYKYCKSTNLEILNTVQGQKRATSLLLKWSRIQFQNSISDSEMHTLWFKSSLFNLESIDQSELGSNTDNPTSSTVKNYFL